MSTTTRVNNFDLIRVLAAAQVLVVHSIHHLGVKIPAWANFMFELLKAFPGVPIFFVISGYLVTLSCQRNSLANYARNRALRIFPLLWASSLLLLLVLLLAKSYKFTALFGWFLGQVTVLQYFTPVELRSFGVGTPNGSLWTIPIEIQFYCLLPLVLAMYRRAGISVLFVLAAVSAATYWLIGAPERNEPVLKVVQCSVACYFPLFALGMVAALYREKAERLFSGRAPVFLAVYLGWWALSQMLNGGPVMSASNPYSYVSAPLLAAVILSAAYTCRSLSEKILKGNDISYGIYVFHMPVINVLIELELKNSSLALPITLFGSVALSLASWRYLEKPALSKRF